MKKMEEKITQTIENLINDFESYPDKYLTESNVRCLLFKELVESQELGQPQKTEDNSYSIPLHTEVRWYGQSAKLKWRSDIVVVDVSSLRVKNNIFRLPSKGYGFNKPLAIIEIKLRRTKGDTDNAFIKKVQEDVRKLKERKREIPGDYPCYLIVLDKKNDIQEKIARADDIKIYYKYSGNKPPSKTARKLLYISICAYSLHQIDGINTIALIFIIHITLELSCMV